MKILDLFRRRASAPVARERLQILLSHERAAHGKPDLLGVLHEEILAAIAKHVTVERDNVQIRMDRGLIVSTLAIDVEVPNSAGVLLAAGSEQRSAAAEPKQKSAAAEPIAISG
jgi:cell division topological specificity factor